MTWFLQFDQIGRKCQAACVMSHRYILAWSFSLLPSPSITSVLSKYFFLPWISKEIGKSHNLLFLLAVLGFELRDIRFYTGAPLSHTSALFALVILEVSSRFLPRLASTTVLLFYTSHPLLDDRCTSPHLAFFYWGGSHWLRTPILLISASHGALDDRYTCYVQLLIEMGSCKLFAQAGFKLPSSQLQHPK
jgi:hypothetical protein